MDRGNHGGIAPTNHQMWIFCVSPVCAIAIYLSIVSRSLLLRENPDGAIVNVTKDSLREIN